MPCVSALNGRTLARPAMSPWPARRALPNFVFAAHVRRHVLAARDALVRRVANAAAGRFWRTLGDFAHLHREQPRRWALTPAHPFLSIQPDGSVGLALPAGAPAPPDEDDTRLFRVVRGDGALIFRLSVALREGRVCGVGGG